MSAQTPKPPLHEQEVRSAPPPRPQPACLLALLAVPPVEVPDDVRAFLVNAAGAFVLAGGRFSTADWLAMTPIERACAVEAGERSLIDRVFRAAAANAGGVRAAEVAAAVDGGASLAAVEEEGIDAAMAELREATHEHLGLKPKQSAPGAP